jgi:hypothetical protein
MTTFDRAMMDAALQMIRDAIVHFRACAEIHAGKADETRDRFYYGLACAEGLAADRIARILEIATGEKYHGQTFDPGPGDDPPEGDAP